MNRHKLTAMLLPWLIISAVGAASAGIVGAAVVNMASEAKTAKEREQQAAITQATESDMPPIPELVIIEPYDANNPDAPS